MTTLPDGAVMVIGGVSESFGALALNEIYDPRDGGGSTLVP